MRQQLQTVPNVGDDLGQVAPTVSVPSEVPDLPAKLTTAEKKVWTHVTQALKEVGLIHRTDGLLLVVICRTFARWVDAEEKLNELVKEKGTYMVTAGQQGYEQPHQIFYVAGKLKKELLQWLPEAALTIPSFQKAVATPGGNQQGSLFEDDPVEAHRQRKVAAGMRQV